MEMVIFLLVSDKYNPFLKDSFYAQLNSTTVKSALLFINLQLSSRYESKSHKLFACSPVCTYRIKKLESNSQETTPHEVSQCGQFGSGVYLVI